MFLKQIPDSALAQYSYLIGCQRTGEAVVVDPERDIDRYEKVAAANGLRIIAAAETHIHADFLSGVREFGEKGARVYVSDEGDADWKYQWLDKKSGGGRYDAVLLRNGDTFKVGNILFRALHTPGHTPERPECTFRKQEPRRQARGRPSLPPGRPYHASGIEWENCVRNVREPHFTTVTAQASKKARLKSGIALF